MIRYFNKPETAERYLEMRRKVAYKRIKKKGWKIIKDKSCVIPHFHKEGKWIALLFITTDEMIKDLEKFRCIDTEKKLEELLKKHSK